jgi:ABC-type amino acid transport substrate-binding protein
LKAVGAAFNPHPPAIAVPKGDVEFVKWINKQLAKMKEDGTYEMFRRRYFGD